MQLSPLRMGPNFEYLSRKDHELHMNRMSEILQKPVIKTQPQVKPKKSGLSKRELMIEEENYRIGKRLFQICNRKKTEVDSYRQSEAMQRYKALLRRRKMERIRLENLSLAERLTRRLTGGYSTTQQELEEMREHLRTEQMVHSQRYDRRSANTRSFKLPKIMTEIKE